MRLKLWVKITIFFLFLVIPVGFFAWKKITKDPRELRIKYPIPIEVVINGLRYQTTTKATKIADFLDEKGIITYSEDLIIPDPERELTPHAVVYITTNRKMSIKVDGETLEVNTIRRTIEKLLKDEKIKLNPFDVVAPELNELTVDDSKVAITRIEKKNITEEQVIDYDTIVKEDEKMTFKKQVIDQEGKNGLKEVEYEMIYKDGELVSKAKLSTEIVQEAQPKIITEGRKVKIISDQEGMASWYAYKGGMYCASVKYPKGTWLRVTSNDNGKQIIVQVNDYGPDPGTGKVIDLDRKAFAKLMSIGAGVISVEIEEIKSD